MKQLPGIHTFRMAVRTDGQIDHADPKCYECGKTISGSGIIIAAHPAIFDNEGGMDYSGDRVGECSALHETCARKAGWMGQEVTCARV